MAKKFYIGVNNTARKARKIYIGINNIARTVKKVYVGVDNVAKLCFAWVKVLYNSTLNLSFTKKEMQMGDTYGNFPTLPSDSNRVDFWFYPDALVGNGSGVKYVDSPWSAYADLYPDLYKQMGYREDYLAQHWVEHGISEGRSLGGLTPTTICNKEDDHTLQHVYSVKTVACTGIGGVTSGKGAFATLYYTDGAKAKEFRIQDASTQFTAYPGMYIIFNAQHINGNAGVGADGSACYVKIDGVKVSGAGRYTYYIPRNVKAISMTGAIDNHWDLGQSWVINVTTTKI